MAAWMNLRDETFHDGSHISIKALVRQHRVTVHTVETIPLRGVERNGFVELTPDAMDKLMDAWQKVRIPKGAS